MYVPFIRYLSLSLSAFTLISQLSSLACLPYVLVHLTRLLTYVLVQVSNLSIELEDLRQQLLAEQASNEERSAKETKLANQLDAMSAQFESLETALASAVADKQALGKQQKAMSKAFAKERAALEDAVHVFICIMLCFGRWRFSSLVLFIERVCLHSCVIEPVAIIVCALLSFLPL